MNGGSSSIPSESNADQSSVYDAVFRDRLQPLGEQDRLPSLLLNPTLARRASDSWTSVELARLPHANEGGSYDRREEGRCRDCRLAVTSRPDHRHTLRFRRRHMGWSVRRWSTSMAFLLLTGCTPAAPYRTELPAC